MSSELQRIREAVVRGKRAESAALLRPHLARLNFRARARAILGTVHGDIHDIGKNIVKMMMEGAGYEVIDLGADVPAEAFVECVIYQGKR